MMAKNVVGPKAQFQGGLQGGVDSASNSDPEIEVVTLQTQKRQKRQGASLQTFIQQGKKVDPIMHFSYSFLVMASLQTL